MNYIREMNAFIDWLEINPSEAITQTLWFHLMAIANKSGWPEWFTVANLTLQAKLCISENTLIKHRNLLIQKGRIEYKNQGKQKAGKYRLIPFTSLNEVIHDSTANFAADLEVNYEVNRAVNCEVNPSALFKLNKTKQNIDDEHKQDQPAPARESISPLSLYQSEIGKATNIVCHEMVKWLTEGKLDEPEEMLCLAIREAVVNEKRSWAYVNSVLEGCVRDGIRTAAQMERQILEFQARKQGKLAALPSSRREERPAKKETRRDTVPQHILDQKAREGQGRAVESSKSQEEYLAKQAQLNEMLRQMEAMKKGG